MDIRYQKKWINLSPDGHRGGSSVKEVVEAFTPDDADDPRPGRLSISYTLNGLWADQTPFGRKIFTSFDLPGAAFTDLRGAPRLVRETLFIDLPQWAELKKVEVSFNDIVELEGFYDILPAGVPVLEGQDPKLAAYPKYYAKAENFPAKMVQYDGVHEFLGRHCACIHITPMQYNPVSRKVSVVRLLVLEMTYGQTDKPAPPAEGEEAPKAADDKPARAPARKERLLGPWGTLILNDAMSDDRKKSDDGGVTVPPVKLMVVTTEKFRRAFEPYLKSRELEREARFLIREEIQKKMPGVEFEDALRLALMTEHNESPITHVLIGGNALRIPPRLISITHKGEEMPVASDSWYATWDDELTPLFSVGRLPASSLEELNLLFKQALIWQESEDSYSRKVLLRAFNSSAYIKCSEQVAQLAEDAGHRIVKCYDQPYRGIELIEKIKQPVGYVNYRGQGRTGGWLGRGHFPDNFASEDLRRLKHKNELFKENHPSIIFSIACWTAAIHHEKTNCFGEAWLLSSMAVSFLGFSAASYSGLNDLMNKYIWEAVSVHRFPTVGDVWRWALLSLLKHQKGTATAHNVSTCLLLGDPTLKLPDPAGFDDDDENENEDDDRDDSVEGEAQETEPQEPVDENTDD
ncbi:hypothetical protein C4J81_00190 [Deltaproteobacteria bacterium Smac51]|nr:hypothetical protein C4J81_00190 [Deltaproteobacteria bacterium Smac51]